MTVVVTEEYIGTGGWLSKLAALRCVVKQPCEVGAGPYIKTLCNAPMGTQHGKEQSDL